MEVAYTHNFIKQTKKLPADLHDEVIEKIDRLKDRNNHKNLKVHKLHGSLSERFSFSVNYKIRIVFKYLDKDTVILLAIGDHDIYN